MAGFEPGSSGIRSNCSANCATTTAPVATVYPEMIEGEIFSSENCTVWCPVVQKVTQR